MKNENFKSFAVLTIICIAVAALMATVNYFTAPVIDKNESAKETRALLAVMPDGKNFIKTEFSGLPASVKQVYKEENGGYVFKLVTSGYTSGLTVMCGIDSKGNVTGAECVLSSETLGKEKTYGALFIGKNKDTAYSVDIVSGATLTTRAYKNAVKDALEAFGILSEGGIDK